MSFLYVWSKQLHSVVNIESFTPNTWHSEINKVKSEIILVPLSIKSQRLYWNLRFIVYKFFDLMVISSFVFE